MLSTTWEVNENSLSLFSKEILHTLLLAGQQGLILMCANTAD